MNLVENHAYKRLELNGEALETLKTIKALINLDWVEKRSYLNETLEKVKGQQTYVC